MIERLASQLPGWNDAAHRGVDCTPRIRDQIAHLRLHEGWSDEALVACPATDSPGAYRGRMRGDAGGHGTLPEYARPPVAEVALGVMFKPQPTLDFAALADLRSRWSDIYPITQQQAAVPPAPAEGEGQPSMLFEVGVPPIRLWFLTRQRDRLVQVQRDRLVANWRAVDQTGPYPRYTTLRTELEERWHDFQRFLLERGTGQAHPLTVEVTYINIVRPRDPAQPVKLTDVLRHEGTIETHLGEPVQASMALTFDLSGIDGYWSRVTVSATPDATASPAPLVLQLTAFATAGDAGKPFERMDVAHDHVVQLFDEITSDAMHTQWGRSR